MKKALKWLRWVTTLFVGLTLLSGCASATEDSAEETREIVLALFDAFNAHDLDADARIFGVVLLYSVFAGRSRLLQYKAWNRCGSIVQTKSTKRS